MPSQKPSFRDYLKGVSTRERHSLLALRHLSQVMSSSLNPAALAEQTINVISQALNAREACLFSVDYEVEQSEDFCQLTFLGGTHEEKPPLLIKNNSPILALFKEQHQIVMGNEMGTLPELSDLPVNELTWFQELGMEYYIPIHVKNDWGGLLAIGQKTFVGKYDDKDLTLMAIMADMLGLAMQNVRLAGSLIRVNNEFRRAYQSMEQSNRNLKQILSKFEKLDQTRSDFITIASHELRTPLTVILGYNEMLMDDPEARSNEYQAQLIAGIQKGIMRMQEIVESMLVMASIDARSLVLKKNTVSIASLVQAAYNSQLTALEERNISFITEKLSDLPQVEADDEALKKVFQQLIQNAIKYTPDGGSITVTGSPATIGPANMKEAGVEIIIGDTGIGIDPKNLELIFTKFYVTSKLAHHSTSKTKFKGSGPGLGLSIAKGIVEAHGGKIWATSPGYDEEKCPGSKFHIILPLKNTLV